MNRLIVHLSFWLHVASCAMVLGADPVLTPVDLPVAAITVTDAHGHPVTDEIGIGQMLVIGSDKSVHGKLPGSLVWVIEPQSMQQFTTGDGATVVATSEMKDSTICIMQLVALGDRVAWQKVKIKVGNGAQPPPVPPGPDPDPKPTPTAGKLFLAVLSDDRRLPAEAVPILNAPKIWESFRAEGDDWRFFDVTTQESIGKRLITDAKTDNVTIPALGIYDLATMKKLAVVPLPKSMNDVKAVRSKYKTGVQQ